MRSSVVVLLLRREEEEEEEAFPLIVHLPPLTTWRNLWNSSGKSQRRDGGDGPMRSECEESEGIDRPKTQRLSGNGESTDLDGPPLPPIRGW